MTVAVYLKINLIFNEKYDRNACQHQFLACSIESSDVEEKSTFEFNVSEPQIRRQKSIHTNV